MGPYSRRPLRKLAKASEPALWLALARAQNGALVYVGGKVTR